MTDRDIQKDRLKEIVKDSLMRHIDKTCSLAENITNDLLANGVIVPPCKVGDIVWFICFGKIYPHKINNFQVSKFGFFACSSIVFNFDDFGKTVFLTKSQAEQALKERESNA